MIIFEMSGGDYMIIFEMGGGGDFAVWIGNGLTFLFQVKVSAVMQTNRLCHRFRCFSTFICL